MAGAAFSFAQHHGVPGFRAPAVVPVAVPVRVLPQTTSWKFVVTLSDGTLLAQSAPRSMSDTEALQEMTALARQWAYAPATQHKGASQVTATGVRWDGQSWQSYMATALVAQQK